jgi:hypothetical protein
MSEHENQRRFEQKYLHCVEFIITITNLLLFLLFGGGGICGGGDCGGGGGGGGGGGEGCDDRYVVVNCLVDFKVYCVSLVQQKTG